ncbi:hypothetical protein [Sorangium cellulosum]|uniref:hypothetical protein n=1 Tax=Sorangium cellulosum TaxID=56 RepID=UPI000CF46A8F
MVAQKAEVTVVARDPEHLGAVEQRLGVRTVSGEVPAWIEGREVLAVFRVAGDERPAYFIELSVADGRVTSIRDFRYVPYIAREATFTITSPARPPPRHR